MFKYEVPIKNNSLMTETASFTPRGILIQVPKIIDIDGIFTSAYYEVVATLGLNLPTKWRPFQKVTSHSTWAAQAIGPVDYFPVRDNAKPYVLFVRKFINLMQPASFFGTS